MLGSSVCVRLYGRSLRNVDCMLSGIFLKGYNAYLIAFVFHR